MFKISWTSTFVKTSKKFLKKHPEFKPDFKELLIQLEEEPFHQRLKLHQLKGRHKEKYSVSLTYSYRVVLPCCKDTIDLHAVLRGGLR